MILGTRLFWELIILTMIIHTIDTFSYSVRLNSVKSGQFALSLSFFNIIVLISRTANTFQGPLIGTMIDKSIELGYNPITDIRKVIFAATAGTLIGIILIPTFLKLFARAVSMFSEAGSIPAIVVQALSINNIKKIAKCTTRPSKNMLRGLRYKNIPKRLLLLNALITGIYTVGVLASFYSSVFIPTNRLAASASSGMINGIASILLTVFVDPQSAKITDEAYRGARPYIDVKALVVMLIGTKLLGTLLGQLLLLPAAKLIAMIYS